MIHIYSTLTADNAYSTKAGLITIHGRLGARHNEQIDTPRGVVTTFEDDSVLEALRANPVFASHEKNWHITVQKRELTETKAAKLIESGDMVVDASAQETEETLKRKPGRPNIRKDID